MCFGILMCRHPDKEICFSFPSLLTLSWLLPLPDKGLPDYNQTLYWWLRSIYQWMAWKEIANPVSKLQDSLIQVLDMKLCRFSPASLGHGSGSSIYSSYQHFFSCVKKFLVLAVNLNPSLPFLGRTFGLQPAGAKFLDGEPRSAQLWCFWASLRFILVLSMIVFFVFILFLNFSCYIYLSLLCVKQRTSSVQELIRYLNWKYKYIVLCNVLKQFLFKFKICASGIIRTLRFSVVQEMGRLLRVK